jgi:hypothetical protein
MEIKIILSTPKMISRAVKVNSAVSTPGSVKFGRSKRRIISVYLVILKIQ